jgi:hypothetical protein
MEGWRLGKEMEERETYLYSQGSLKAAQSSCLPSFQNFETLFPSGESNIGDLQLRSKHVPAHTISLLGKEFVPLA